MINSIEKGRQALEYFYDASKRYSGFSYSFDQMLEIISGGPKSVQFFLDGMGTAILSIQSDGFLSDSKLKTAMTNLANLSKGQLPNRNYFFSALSQEAQNVTFIDAVPSIVSGSLGTITEGFKEVGESLIDTGKIITLVFPFVAIAALFYIGKEKVKKVAKK